jgi:Ca2+-binding RTX toxin-like protein
LENGDGDELYGGAGNDLISSFAGHGLLDGGAGNDTLIGSGIDDFVFSVAPGEANWDVVFFDEGADKLVLDASAFPEIGRSGSFSSGDDRFQLFGGTGTPGGFDAEDRILYHVSTGELWYDPDGNGISAAQRIAILEVSGPGAPALAATDISVINGSAPGSVINGTAGNDTLTGTTGNDTINGLGGNDLIQEGSGGIDVVDGGAGSDSIEFKTAATGALVVNYGTGSITGGSGSISFTSVERVVAGNFNDQLIGAAGGQNLAGQNGNDTLAGGAGVDTLWGGLGNDRFNFREMGSANADRIGDFASGQDKIQLDDSAFTAMGSSGNLVANDPRFFAAAGASSGHDVNDRVIYNTSTGALYYDSDGSGSGASQLVATLTTIPTLSATDIAVI